MIQINYGDILIENKKKNAPLFRWYTLEQTRIRYCNPYTVAFSKKKIFFIIFQ